MDGATGANNPVNVLWIEAMNIWKPADDNAHFEDDVQCLVLIGTGMPAVNDFGSALKEVGNALKDMATETEKTHENFMREHARLYRKKRYYRFNVQEGLQGIGLEETNRLHDIVTAAARYLAQEEHKSRMDECAGNLQVRECMPDYS